MAAVVSLSSVNRLERQKTRDALFSDDDPFDPDVSDDSEGKPVVRGRGRGRGRGRRRGRGSGRGRGRGRGRGAANAVIAHADDTEIAPGITRRTMSGTLPSFNDYSNVLTITERRISVCRVEQGFLWEDWTELIGYPFQKPFPLPRLKCASATYLAMNGCEYVFLFGGYNSDCNGTTSALIAIDVATKMWSYVSVEGDVIARVDAALVGVKNRLYPYPIHVPGLGYDGRAIAVFNGVKIMLTAGRLRNGRSVRNPSFQEPFTHTTKVLVKQETVTVDPFALICGWVSIPGSTDLAPEIWKFVLPPVEKMQCLNIRQKILNLEMDLQCFIAVGGRFFFLGSGNMETYNLCLEVDLRAMEDSAPPQLSAT
ncbi:hypothetical protein BDZ89DRAFT_1068110 [Hymenopellis radicata]|nr:hypothetical protein BDZ89DRAFT_1068110 [Hymenopellis radicata]